MEKRKHSLLTSVCVISFMLWLYLHSVPKVAWWAHWCIHSSRLTTGWMNERVCLLRKSNKKIRFNVLCVISKHLLKRHRLLLHNDWEWRFSWFTNSPLCRARYKQREFINYTHLSNVCFVLSVYGTYCNTTVRVCKYVYSRYLFVLVSIVSLFCK